MKSSSPGIRKLQIRYMDEKGNKFAFYGIYHEVLVPERIIGTFEFESILKKGT